MSILDLITESLNKLQQQIGGNKFAIIPIDDRCYTVFEELFNTISSMSGLNIHVISYRVATWRDEYVFLNQINSIPGCKVHFIDYSTDDYYMMTLCINTYIDILHEILTGQEVSYYNNNGYTGGIPLYRDYVGDSQDHRVLVFNDTRLDKQYKLSGDMSRHGVIYNGLIWRDYGIIIGPAAGFVEQEWNTQHSNDDIVCMPDINVTSKVEDNSIVLQFSSGYDGKPVNVWNVIRGEKEGIEISIVYGYLDNNPPDATYDSEPVPEYKVVIPTPIVEDSSILIEIIIRTKHVPKCTILYWSIVGSVNSSDFIEPELSGSICMKRSCNMIEKHVKTDFNTEGDEFFVVQLRTGSNTGPIVATSKVITVTDTSQWRFIFKSNDPPPGYTPVYPSNEKENMYNDFLIEYGVWESDLEGPSCLRDYTINFPITGDYCFRFCVDNVGSVYVDDIQIYLPDSNGYSQLNNYHLENFRDIHNTTVCITAGNHLLRLYGWNIHPNTPGSIALTIHIKPE